MYISSDSATWGTALQTYTNTMAGTDGANSDLKLGLFAHNGNNAQASEITASFNYHHSKVVRKNLPLWLDHGADPTDASYEYIMLPGKTSQETASYSSSPEY